MKKSDAILLAAVAAAACLLALLFNLGGRGADRVSITVDGAEYRSVPLSRDQRIDISIDGRLNVVALEGGAAYMHSANCPDKLCVRQGRISSGSQSIVCLPNRVVVKLIKAPAAESGGDGDGDGGAGAGSGDGAGNTGGAGGRNGAADDVDTIAQ
jgi:hypothetical protein